MVDIVTKQQRSANMSKIRSTDTKPELIVRKYLYSKGYRYRLHVKDLPGKPDIVMRRLNLVIFVHGCFWHRHQGCRLATTPDSNGDFWKEKFRKNVVRDKTVIESLISSGWRVIVIWECGLKSGKVDSTLAWISKIISQTNTGPQFLEYPVNENE